MPSPENPSARAVDAPPRRAARDAEEAPRARTPIPTGAIVIAAIVFVAVATRARSKMEPRSSLFADKMKQAGGTLKVYKNTRLRAHYETKPCFRNRHFTFRDRR